MKSTREKILNNLLKFPRSSINDLAKSVGINAISVRHHLTNLQAEALVNADEERHGVGRPRLVYFLTEKGLEHFPTHYLRLTNHLLNQVKDTLPEKNVKQIFEQIAKKLAEDHTPLPANSPIEERLDVLKNILTKEGFLIEWELKDGEYQINEISCPYYHIGQSHPEVCIVDQTLISTLLSIPVKRVNCVLNGDDHCTFIVKT
ncbi:MAG: winged helix-turn-helix transcriptional regulator [Anaerolineaceae bacterium]|nr:winged helix-turn-helix transcriptional regulator [Anaerolineaceae bacterium]